ncbi:uncharacterized protein TNCV_2947571 [Trichonephila clavipes]|nr:uncharacterized protein TNCV_2947571 [Trichonephila clavipes]
MRSACDQSTLPIDVQVFHCKARDPHVEAWRVGCHLSRSPRHPTEVPNHTVFERRVRYKERCARENTSILCGEPPSDFEFQSSDEDDPSPKPLTNQTADAAGVKAFTHASFFMQM